MGQTKAGTSTSVGTGLKPQQMVRANSNTVTGTAKKTKIHADSSPNEDCMDGSDDDCDEVQNLI